VSVTTRLGPTANEPHWFLDILAVQPDRQGQRIGASLPAHALAEVDRAGVPAFVATSRQRNLPLYERFGFAVTEEFHTGPVRLWAMLRSPKPA
jgi:predicted N-acetyltransferase YhbS